MIKNALNKANKGLQNLLEKRVADPPKGNGKGPNQPSGVRGPWSDFFEGDLDPGTLADVLARVAKGDMVDYLKLAEQLEERYATYRATLQTRVQAVGGKKFLIKPASDDEKDQEIANFVRTSLVEKPAFKRLLSSCLDGLSKGYAVTEIIWQDFLPVDFVFRDPKWFKFDKQTGQTLRLLSPDGKTDSELPPYKFVIHYPRLKAGLPARSGLAMPVLMYYMYARFALHYWGASGEKFGMPMTIGRYDKQATDADKKTLAKALQALAQRAMAVVPDGMEIEIVNAQAAAKNGVQIYDMLMDRMDTYVAQIVVGQTMTSNNGSSEAQARVHKEIKDEILDADCEALEETINEQIIKPLVIFHFGDSVSIPRFVFDLKRPEDIKVLAETAAIAINELGLDVSASDLRERLGLKKPKDDKDQAIGQEAGPEQNGKAQANRLEINISDPDNPDDPLVAFTDLENWEEVLEPIFKPIRDAILQATSFDEAIALLDQVPESDLGPLAQDLGKQFFKARAHGDVSDG